jgi:hypothetical protein
MEHQSASNTRKKEKIPKLAWRRNFNAAVPDKSVHNFSRPPVLDIISLLPVAMRVHSYIYNERSSGREPIFDMSGIGLEVRDGQTVKH